MGAADRWRGGGVKVQLWRSSPWLLSLKRPRLITSTFNVPTFNRPRWRYGKPTAAGGCQLPSTGPVCATSSPTRSLEIRLFPGHTGRLSRSTVSFVSCSCANTCAYFCVSSQNTTEGFSSFLLFPPSSNLTRVIHHLFGKGQKKEIMTQSKSVWCLRLRPLLSTDLQLIQTINLAAAIIKDNATLMEMQLHKLAIKCKTFVVRNLLGEKGVCEDVIYSA